MKDKRGGILMKGMIGVRTVKTALGTTLAILIAEALGLQFATSAGIITILSIQSTKKQSIEVAIKRTIATIVALVLATILFGVLGHDVLVFGLFLLLFIPITARYRITEGIVSASVLVTHLLLAEHITGALLVNEMLLVIVGAGVALVLNLYMPSIEQDLYKIRLEIEDDMYFVFMEMAMSLEKQSISIEEQRLYQQIELAIQRGKQRAYRHTNNHLFSDVTVYERYFEMRDDQFQAMRYMRQHFTRIFMTLQESKEVAYFTRRVAESIKGRIASRELMVEMEALRAHFRESELPKTREEFENRAMLYQFLNDIELFLEIKKQFRDDLTEEEFEEYQKGYE